MLGDDDKDVIVVVGCIIIAVMTVFFITILH